MDVRLDVWLNVACLFKTRSQAKRACDSGRIRVNGLPAKAQRKVNLEDRIEFRQGPWQRAFVVKGIEGRPVPKAEARKLYRDLSPPRPRRDRLSEILGPVGWRERGAGRPTKRERRRIERLKD